MKRLLVTAALTPLVALLACGDAEHTGPSSTTVTRGSSATTTAPTASASAPTATARAALTRKAAPEQRRLEDEKACDGGDVIRCRRAADRYRGYGHIAGCGVTREATGPRRKVTFSDAEDDARLFDRWIRKACDLGDEDACLQGTKNLGTPRVTETIADGCARSALDDCPLYLWAKGMRPETEKPLQKARRSFMNDGYHGKLFVELYRKEKARGGDTLPEPIAALAESICATTLECDDVFMMLDKNGYTAAALAPLRAKVGERLTAACLEGVCACGEAARYLDPGDPRVLDLARIGCEDGEPEACFVLGDLHERGAFVEKSAAKALSLYELGCPPVVATDAREDVYSKLACARLAQRYEEGDLLEKDQDRAFFYSTLACTRPGFERHHEGCLRRGLLHFVHSYYNRANFLQTTTDAGRDFFFGVPGEPVNAKECERPSVAEACKQQGKAIH